MPISVAKNRNRDPFSFANINLLGKCNVDCFFCLGKDIQDLLCTHHEDQIHFNDWKNFPTFLPFCRNKGIGKIYITGQNTDSLVYPWLHELVTFLHGWGFKVGLRTNGYLAPHKILTINECELSTGYSIHSINPVTNRMIMGRSDIPNWPAIIGATERPRISIVINRCNAHEFLELLEYLSAFKNIRYIQARRVSTDTRLKDLMVDIEAYEQVYQRVRAHFEKVDTIFGNAEVYRIFGHDVNFWRTTQTTANSVNYFTDGTISDEYFIVEGYLRNRVK